MERENAWKSYTQTEIKKIFNFAEEYKALLDAYQIPYDEKFLFND